jgi:hypothetical protein
MVRPLSRIEGDQLIDEIVQKQQMGTATVSENILLRRLSQRVSYPSLLRRVKQPMPFIQGSLVSGPDPSTELPPVVEALDEVIEPPAPPREVLEGLYAIKSTPLENSFASRLYGGQFSSPTIFFQDWKTISPWTELMVDVMNHHSISWWVWPFRLAGSF